MSASQRGLQLPDAGRSHWWQSEEDAEASQETICEGGAPHQRMFSSEGTVGVSGSALEWGTSHGMAAVGEPCCGRDMPEGL